MIGVEDWAEIRRLHRAEKMSIKGIARHLGIARNTVRRAVASDDPPNYRRAPKGSIVDAVEPAIRELLAEYPRMPATVIAAGATAHDLISDQSGQCALGHEHTCDCFLRDLPSQYQAVQVKGGASPCDVPVSLCSRLRGDPRAHPLGP